MQKIRYQKLPMNLLSCTVVPMTITENHHAEVAQFSSIDEPRRLIEATLAIAYEQRTANLIALYKAEDLANLLETREWDAVAEQIKERLGL